MASKTELNRAGTMEVTAQDGKSFLDRNLTDWKKPYLMDQFDEEDEEDVDDGESTAKKPKMSKHTTMKGTAKEAAQYLADKDVDEDVLTRGQQKKLEEIKDEKPTPKKTKMARDNTMANTAKEAKALIGKEKLGDTRQVTKQKKAAPKRQSTLDTVVSEAQAVYGDLSASEGRSLRKRPAPPKASLKKAGTMQKTAKEGKAFLKRSKKN